MPEKRDAGWHFPQKTDIGAGADGLSPVWGASRSLNSTTPTNPKIEAPPKQANLQANLYIP
jgi:hypothetical protein